MRSPRLHLLLILCLLGNWLSQPLQALTHSRADVAAQQDRAPADGCAGHATEREPAAPVPPDNASDCCDGPLCNCGCALTSLLRVLQPPALRWIHAQAPQTFAPVSELALRLAPLLRPPAA